jgi:uncharacterized protein YxeA
MKPTILLVMVSIINIVFVILIFKYTFHHIKSDEQNCTISQKSRAKKHVAIYNLPAIQQLHLLFTTTECLHKKIYNAKELYTHTVQALPKISATLKRLSKAYAKLSYNDQAFTAYETSRSLDPLVLIRSYCSTIKPSKYSKNSLYSTMMRSKLNKMETLYVSYKKRILLNKIRTIAHATCNMHMRSTKRTSILN